MKIDVSYWKDGDHHLGHLEDYPVYQTQGERLDDLKEHLLDLYQDLSNDAVPGVRRHGELIVPQSASNLQSPSP